MFAPGLSVEQPPVAAAAATAAIPVTAPGMAHRPPGTTSGGAHERGSGEATYGEATYGEATHREATHREATYGEGREGAVHGPHPSEINPEWEPPEAAAAAAATGAKNDNLSANTPKRRNVDGVLEPAADYMARLHAWRAAQNDQCRANTAPTKSCPACGHRSPLRCHTCRNERCNHAFTHSTHPKAIRTRAHREKKRKERVAKDHSECVLCRRSLKSGQRLAIANCAEERMTAVLEQIRKFNKTCRDSSTSVCGIRSLDINAILRSGAKVIAAGRSARATVASPACGRTAHLACMKKMMRERVDPDYGRVYPKCPYCNRLCTLQGGVYHTEILVNQTAFLRKVPKKRRVGAAVVVGNVRE